MILFIDDEVSYVQSYIQELRDSGYEAVIQDKIDFAVKFFEENRSQIELVILDIIMPPGSVFGSLDTRFGLRTGFHMYDWLRQQDAKLPVIILTNSISAEIERKFAGESNCWFYRKDQCLPFELVEHVKQIMPDLRSRQQNT